MNTAIRIADMATVLLDISDLVTPWTYSGDLHPTESENAGNSDLTACD